MVKPSEFQILMLAASFSPLLYWAYRGIRVREKCWVGLGLLAMFGAYAATVAEGFFAEEVLNAAEHALYAMAGVLFAVAALALLRHLRATETRQ